MRDEGKEERKDLSEEELNEVAGGRGIPSVPARRKPGDEPSVTSPGSSRNPGSSGDAFKDA